MKKNTKKNEKEKMSLYEKAVCAPFVIGYTSLIIFYASMLVVAVIMWIVVFTRKLIVPESVLEIICFLGPIFGAIFLPISIIFLIALRVFYKLTHKDLPIS